MPTGPSLTSAYYARNTDFPAKKNHQEDSEQDGLKKWCGVWTVSRSLEGTQHKEAHRE